MIVCKRCMTAIESHEGNLPKRKLSYFDDMDKANENDLIICEWCDEEYDISEMYEI